MKKARLYKVLKVLLFLLILFPLTSYALKSDRNKKVNITANSSVINTDTGKRTFTGNVLIVQGTTHIKGDIVTVYTNKNNQLEKIIAIGKRAEFNTIPKLNSPRMYGFANVINYLPNQYEITLTGNAKSKQGKNNIEGPVIIYNTQTQIVTTPKSKKGRTNIIIFPQNSKTKKRRAG